MLKRMLFLCPATVLAIVGMVSAQPPIERIGGPILPPIEQTNGLFHRQAVADPCTPCESGRLGKTASDCGSLGGKHLRGGKACGDCANGDCAGGRGCRRFGRLCLGGCDGGACGRHGLCGRCGLAGCCGGCDGCGDDCYGWHPCMRAIFLLKNHKAFPPAYETPAVNPAFPTHPYLRSPRDYFME